jgi:hypothetical protein
VRNIRRTVLGRACPNQALANLRSILSSLRQVVDDYLLVTRNTVAFNHEGNYWLDAAAFQHQLTPLLQEPSLTPAQAQQLNDALTLYCGNFLAGFHLRESRAFNVPSRHRSLRASYDYSWQLLAPMRRRL